MSTCLCLAMVAASCNHDGRTLRPARPDQNASISTTVAPTEPTGPDLGQVLDEVSTVPLSPPASGAEATSTEPGSTVARPSSLDAEAPWGNGAAIDPRYTCAGDDIAPALSWPAAPSGTVEVAITMIDQQNADFAHWEIAGLTPDTTELAEGVVPLGAVQGLNGRGAIGYAGPCPPSGETHTYLITVHYLSAQIELGNGTSGADMRLAIDAATSASAQVTGTFKSA